MRALRSAQRRGRFAITVGVGVFLAVAILTGLGRLRSAENALLGMSFQLRGTREVADEVLLLTLEEGSVSVARGGLPWSREGLAELVRRLDEAGAEVIGLDLPTLAGDVIPARSPATDRMLAEAMRAHGKVVLPMVIRERATVEAKGSEQLEAHAIGSGELPRPQRLRAGRLAAPCAVLIDAAAGLGATNIYPDLDGAAREAPLVVSWDGNIYPSFWLELIRQWKGADTADVDLPDRRVRVGEETFTGDAEMEVLINYAGGYRAFPRLAYDTVAGMSSKSLRKAVDGRIVVVGTDLAGVTTLLRTPTAPLMPGVEIAATITENLASGVTLRRVPVWVSLLLTFVLAILVAVFVGRETPLNGLLICLIALVPIPIVSFILFNYNIHLQIAPPMLAVAIVGLILVADSASTAERERAEAEARLQSRLQAIAGIGRLVNSSLDRDQLLVEILRWAESEIDAEASSLLTMDPDGEHLRFEVALGDKAETLQDITLRVGEGIAGTAAQTREPIVAQDVQDDERWSPDVAYAIDYETRSILCVPMMLRDEVIGVIEVLNKRGGPFTEYDVQLLQVIGHLSALFIENARLYRALSEKVDLANQELRQANERLEFEMARIATLVDEMADAVVATDEADRIVIFNNAAESMFGLPEREAVGNSAITVFDQEEVAALFTRPLSPHGGSYETEITIDEDEDLVVRAHIALIDQPQQTAVGKCALFTDISHLKQLDRMRMDLISFVSHELKNPIASLQGSCRLLHDRLDIDDERTARLLEIATRQSRRMQYLVQDFLDLSRIEAGQELALGWSEIPDLEELITGAIALCRDVGEEHELRVAVDETTPTLYADRNKIEAVLINLIENAVKYSPDGGEVVVRARPGDDEILIEVEDQGVGIRQEDIPKLFRSFQRIHDDTYGEVSGTGVGLYICQHIVEAHGGRIEVGSTWGEGSTFRIHLPRREGPPVEDQGGTDG